MATGLGLCLFMGLASGCGPKHETAHAVGDGNTEETHPPKSGGTHETGHTEGGETHEAAPRDGDSHEATHTEAGEPTMKISLSPGSLTPGMETSMTLTVTGPEGKPVTLEDLVEAHTKKIHLLAVDPGLTDYHHIHPVAADKPGTYGFEFTPKKSGEYRVFADLVPMTTGKQEYDGTSLTVKGEADAVEEKTNNEVTVDGLAVSIAFEKPELVAGVANMMTLSITGTDGKPFMELEPIMGAFAHLVAFNKDRSNIAHVHPMGEEPKSDAAKGGPALQFHLNFAEPGYQKLFAQFKIAGKDVFAPFGLEVMPGDKQSHGDNGAPADGHGGHEEKMEIPDTAELIITEVDEHLEALDTVVAGGKLDQVHGIAFAVRDMLLALPGKLADLPPDVSTSLETSLGKIQQQAELLDKYGDSGNAAQTQTVLGKFKTEIEGIKKLVAGHMTAGAANTETIKMAANKTCPISGSESGSMEKDAHVDYGGYRVGLCCSGCVAKFMKDPDANLKKALTPAK
jgi:hypothetical protein